MNRWDITVKQSNYDFNPFRESDHGKYFKTVTNIYEDWSKELEYANKQQYDFYWPSPVKPGGDHFDYEYENKLVYLMSIEKARFRNPVIPDCELHLDIEAVRSHGRVWKYKGIAKVNDVKMADALWSATIVDRK